MTTFNIDNTKKTKHLEVLESLVEQGHALLATHNPHTWRLSALTFALHLHDCYILFSQLKTKWAKQLPLSEAWDVDLSEWKSSIWSLVNNVSSFTEYPEYSEWQSLCEEDYHTFISKANECLSGVIPLKDLTDFLLGKNTELKKVIIDSGRNLSELFKDVEEMLCDSDPALYETFYDDLANIYIRESADPYQIDDNGIPSSYERWKASKSRKRLPESMLAKVKAANAAMLEIKFWQETWSECFDVEKQEIDKEGFARFIFQNRKNIIDNKNYSSDKCLGRCFSTLLLCEHLWKEYDDLKNAEERLNVQNTPDCSTIYPETVKKVFCFPNEFVQSCVETITKEFYQGHATNLALIERVFFDHGQLKKNNQHKNFVQALVDWGIMETDTDVKQIASGISSKLRSPFPKEGYKSWGKDYTNDAETCKKISQKLPESMKYCRE